MEIKSTTSEYLLEHGPTSLSSVNLKAAERKAQHMEQNTSHYPHMVKAVKISPFVNLYFPITEHFDCMNSFL